MVVCAGLELNKIHRFLDWINIMTYDFHGAWDSATNFHTPWVNNAVSGRAGGGMAPGRLRALSC